MSSKSPHFLVIDSPDTDNHGTLVGKRFVMDLGWLRSLGVRVVRCLPDDEEATQLYLRLDYPAALPAIAAGDRWLAQGRYPSRAELAAVLGDDDTAQTPSSSQRLAS